MAGTTLWARLASADNDAEICAAILDAIQDEWPTVGVALCRLGKQGPRLLEARGLEVLEARLVGMTALMERLKAGHAVDSADITGTPLRKMGVRMAYPLIGSGVLNAVLMIAPTADTPAQREADHRLLWSWCYGAAMSFDRLAWRKRVEAGSGRTNRQSLAQLARSFGLTHSVLGLLKRILAGAIVHTGASKGSLMLLDEETDELVVRVVQGLPDVELEDRINCGAVPCVRLKLGHGVAGRVAATGKTERIEDVRTSPSFTDRKRVNVGALLCVPLWVEGRAVGVMNLTSTASSDVFDASTVAKAEDIARDAAVAIYRTQIFERSCTDSKTGLFVGQVVESLLDNEVVRARRYGSRLSVVACRLGPDCGDSMGLSVGGVFRKTMRLRVDMAGHFGEGWFGIVLPETAGAGAKVLCERLGMALIEANPTVSIRHFVAAEWDGEEVGFALFERALSSLETLDETLLGTQVRLL
jgi:GAF domain-containing protein